MFAVFAEDGAGEGNRSRVYERWEESSLAVSNLSQVFLHLATLDRSVKWDRSALLARCRICRRKGDADKMLLCDGCDRGHHMYCLKPPMTVGDAQLNAKLIAAIVFILV